MGRPGASSRASAVIERPCLPNPATPMSSPPSVPHRDELAAFRALHAITKQVHQSLDLTATLDSVAQAVVQIGGFGVAVVNLARPDDTFEVVTVAGDESARTALLGNVETAQRWKQLLERSERMGNLCFIDHRRGPPLSEEIFTWVPDVTPVDDEAAWHPLDALFAPLMAPSGEWIGVLSVDLPDDGRRPGPLRLEVLEMFADQAAIAIEHARMHSALQARETQARYAANHDSLTGLGNRALLMSAGHEMSQRPGGQLAVLLIDLDGFKEVNDSAGHRFGDEVLCAVASRLSGCVRGGDLVARAGGDEFVVVMFGAQVEPAARSLQDRLAAVLAQPIANSSGTCQIGASIGLAVQSTPVSFSQVLSAADATMYAQKHARARDLGATRSAAAHVPQA